MQFTQTVVKVSNDYLFCAPQKSIYLNTIKTGIIAPPVLIDINGDSVSDIIISLFNSTVLAIDGQNYSIIWKKEFPNSESHRQVLQHVIMSFINVVV